MWQQRTGALPLLLLAAAVARAGDDPAPEVLLLARFKQAIRQELARTPNYTCLETIVRSERKPHARSFQPVDTVRLEVSFVDGKELFAWPGARHFEDQELASLVPGGATGTGMFALYTHDLFVNDRGTSQYRGEEMVEGRRAVRFDFRMPRFGSGLALRIGTVSATVPWSGSFWLDPVSLDLMRLDVFAEAMPPDLLLAEAVNRTYYTRAHIGESGTLLPERSEMVLTSFSGGANRNLIEFSNCHEYRSESTISFAAPETLPEIPKTPVREVELPAGLVVSVALETAIDSQTATIGDPVRARVMEGIRHKGEVVLPKGAVITGRLRKLEHYSSPESLIAVGIQLSEIEWKDARAKFSGEMLEIDDRFAGMQQLLKHPDGERRKVTIDTNIPGVSVFFMRSARFRIAPGVQMLWRTVDAAGR